MIMWFINTQSIHHCNVDKVPSPFDIPDVDALTAGEYNRDRVVVVGTIALRCQKRSVSRAQAGDAHRFDEDVRPRQQ